MAPNGSTKKKKKDSGTEAVTSRPFDRPKKSKVKEEQKDKLIRNDSAPKLLRIPPPCPLYCSSHLLFRTLQKLAIYYMKQKESL